MDGSAVAASLLIATLVGGIVMTSRQARRAERRFNDVRRLANLFIFDYHDAIASLPGATPVRQRLVKDALEYLDSLSQEAGVDPALQRELAAAYLKIGNVQGGNLHTADGRPIAASNLGDTAGAVESYRKAAAIYQSLVTRTPSDVELH